MQIQKYPSHIKCTGNCGYCAHKSKHLKISKGGNLRTKSECDLIEHNMKTKHCNPLKNNKTNYTYIISDIYNLKLCFSGDWS